MEHKIFLLDAYALIFRSYYAFIKNPRINSKGLNTSAIFGFVNTLEEILKNEKPSHIAVAFDPPSPNFRHKMFPDYKATREATPEDIKLSVPYIKDILDAYKIPVVQVDNYEADDVIGTLAKKFVNQDNIIYMMTPDKDFAQLVEENILLYKPARGGNKAEVLGVKEVNEKFGIDDPVKVIDILALWGDASDNVPGVPGVGQKTAPRLISKFGSIENIYQNINKLVGKQKDAFVQNEEQVYLSRKLVTIETEVPIECELDQLIIEEPDYNKLSKIFEELEFRTLQQRIIGSNAKADNIQQSQPNEKEKEAKSSTPQTGQLQFDLFSQPQQAEKIPEPVKKDFSDLNYKLIDTQFLRKELIAKIRECGEFCFDTETSGLNIYKDEIIGIAFAVNEKEAFYVIMPEDFAQTKQILEEFKDIFAEESISKTGQNLKFDIAMLGRYEIKVKGKLFDTMIAHYLLEPEQKHNLDFLAQKFLNYSMLKIEELIGPKGKNQKSMRDVDIEILTNYACEDADITLRLKNLFEKNLENHNLQNLFYNIEMPLVPVLVRMERNGVKIDSEKIRDYSHDLQKDLKTIETEIYQLAGEEFNIASPKQLGIVLFEKLKVSSNPKKTKTNQYSTGEEELVKLADKHPIINKILEFRGLNKLLNTYVDVLPDLVNSETGRLHTSFNQTITSTGRLSSNNPNLQNIPIREERGREIRRAFVASDNEHTFFSADYSQIELRLMAHLSGDENMIDAFCKHSLDIHTATAAKIFKIDKKEVSREMRGQAKTANFGIIYGISAFGLSQRLNISRTDAKSLIDSYFENFPGVKKFMDECISVARDNEYVETIFGRRRYLPDINSRNAIVRGFAERNAINAPIQGSSADIIKLAMVKIHNEFEKLKLKSKITLQVHDELNFDVLKEELDIVKEIVVNKMQNVIKLKVPLLVECSNADNWLDAH
jgi:DNA polymerase I